MDVMRVYVALLSHPHNVASASSTEMYIVTA